jgi:predicted RNA-binding protein YlxR (DUF448 family)
MSLLGEKGHHIPERTCVVCGNKRAKAELFRLVLDDARQVCLDVRQDRQGRGAYVCRNPECLARLTLSRLQKTLKRPLPQTAWNSAQAMMEAFESHGGQR